MFKFIITFVSLIATLDIVSAKLPDLTPEKTVKTTNEILQLHASHKEITPEIMKRIFQNYLEDLDPLKTYFIKSDIIEWLEPSNELLQRSIEGYKEGDFTVFQQMMDVMVESIENRGEMDREIVISELPEKVDAKEFKEMKWVDTKDGLRDRLLKIRSLQVETASKLNEELKEKSLQRIEKRQAKSEEELLSPDIAHRNKLMYTKVLKATASALDTHTAYYTPEEAKQFMFYVQQRLHGIGAQLRDDINGFTVVKIVEGGPAFEGKLLKEKDRIIAVEGEPVVGMGIEDAVELIRGKENTPVVLTVIRMEGEGENKREVKLDLTLMRGEVVVKDARIESSYEPYGEGVVAYLRLHTFYQDKDSSSALDLTKEFNAIKKEHKIEGVVLDLRYNSGGVLPQAVEVAGLFITKGIVVSIKDNTGAVQHLRDLDGKTLWDGPLVVLVNKASASASEIVAQTLQDYGRAIVVGDETTYGKGSFQTFTLNAVSEEVNPDGEYKVTRGRYYTPSGKTPQRTGVRSDIVLPGLLSEMAIGEKYSKYPLEEDYISPNFDDDLSDVSFFLRDQMSFYYKNDLQKRINRYNKHIPLLKKNAEYRISKNKNYQTFLKEIEKAKGQEEMSEEEIEEKQFGQNDIQLTEAINVLKDLIFIDKINECVSSKK